MTSSFFGVRRRVTISPAVSTAPTCCPIFTMSPARNVCRYVML